MAHTQNKLKVGPDSFWEMTALATDGSLASCESCVGFVYFQSESNCRIYLDACADAGLVEKVSLLNLRADADLDSPTARRWYDQAIYISAPSFRILNPDLARRKVENTANAVYHAYFIYHELLNADDDAISAAYARAVEEGLLRNAEDARDRRDVNLSSIAQMRLILDGFKSKQSAGNKKRPESERLRPAEVEARATEQTVDFILSAADGPAPDTKDKTDRGFELDQFITSFLIDPFRLKDFSRGQSPEPPDEIHVQLLLLISELCRRRYEILSVDPDQAYDFVRSIRKAVAEAKVKHSDNQDYLSALSDFAENLNTEQEQLPALPFVSAIQLGSTFESISF